MQKEIEQKKNEENRKELKESEKNTEIFKKYVKKNEERRKLKGKKKTGKGETYK